jgi:hypothetical protein
MIRIPPQKGTFFNSRSFTVSSNIAHPVVDVGGGSVHAIFRRVLKLEVPLLGLEILALP